MIYFTCRSCPGRRELLPNLGGFVLFLLDRIPTEGDSVSWGGYSLEVVDMDVKRIDKLLVTLLEYINA